MVGVVAHLTVQLCGQDDVVAPAGERLADDLLRFAGGVDVGRVDEVEAGVEGGMDDADALVVVPIAEPAEHHRAEAQRADLDACRAERAVPHGCSPCLATTGRQSASGSC